MTAGPIYLTADIRRIEKAAGDLPLMQRAGAAAADLAVKLVGDKSKDVLVLAGPGNNGGDARIAAQLLKEKFFRVAVAERPEALPEGKQWGLIVDGLFGIGLTRPVEGEYAKLIEYANRQKCPVLALDVPSGIQSDTGRVLGTAIRATHTITFIALKPGLLTLDGPDHAAEIAVASLDLPVNDLLPPTAWTAGPHLFPLKPRPRNFHKGMAGSLGILGGAHGMTGAALLAGRAALRLGAGRVHVGFLQDRFIEVDPLAPELMLRRADDVLGLDLDAIVAGPGLGTSEHGATLVGAALASEMACVLDADALNLMAGDQDLRKACARRTADTLLTPHPAEAGRLLGVATADVQADRVGAAQRLAGVFNAHVVLKGNGSVLAARGGRWFINTSGNPGMASAGMGDVLAGMLGALLAQRYTGEAALVLGAHLHGAAADMLVRSGAGPVGMTAGELIEPARRLWNEWLLNNNE
jgi:ADP-dependent NAD(P)H-hydrate dehydratase / NAD(P)H-hydrate epimerase